MDSLQAAACCGCHSMNGPAKSLTSPRVSHFIYLKLCPLVLCILSIATGVWATIIVIWAGFRRLKRYGFSTVWVESVDRLAFPAMAGCVLVLLGLWLFPIGRPPHALAAATGTRAGTAPFRRASGARLFWIVISILLSAPGVVMLVLLFQVALTGDFSAILYRSNLAWAGGIMLLWISWALYPYEGGQAALHDIPAEEMPRRAPGRAKLWRVLAGTAFLAGAVWSFVYPHTGSRERGYENMLAGILPGSFCLWFAWISLSWEQGKRRTF